MTVVPYPTGVRIFSLYQLVQTDSGAQPVSYQIGIGGSFPGDKADHSPPSNAKSKNLWSYTSTLPYVLMAWYSVKDRISLHGTVFTYRNNFISLYFNFTVRCKPNHQSPVSSKISDS
jgi:hypothetical protein